MKLDISFSLPNIFIGGFCHLKHSPGCFNGYIILSYYNHAIKYLI